MDDGKSTICFVFYMGGHSLHLVSKKQSIVTLSKCEAEYVAATSCDLEGNHIATSHFCGKNL